MQCCAGGLPWEVGPPPKPPLDPDVTSGSILVRGGDHGPAIPRGGVRRADWCVDSHAAPLRSARPAPPGCTLRGGLPVLLGGGSAVPAADPDAAVPGVLAEADRDAA